MHLRHMVWRDSKDKEWSTYALERMHFGERPAACGLTVALEKDANAGEIIDLEAADAIHRGYIDDAMDRGSSDSVAEIKHHLVSWDREGITVHPCIIGPGLTMSPTLQPKVLLIRRMSCGKLQASPWRAGRPLASLYGRSRTREPCACVYHLDSCWIDVPGEGGLSGNQRTGQYGS